MGQIEISVASRYKECSLAVYHDDDGEQFNVVFHRDLKDGQEQTNIMVVEKNGAAVPQTDPVWRRIKQALKK